MGTMAFDADTLIAGGGIVGATLAIALARAGVTVVLADANPQFDAAACEFDGRAYALSSASCKLLESLGFGPLLIESGQPILSVRVSEGRPGEGARGPVLEFGRGDADTWPLGRMIEDRHLRCALLEAVASEARVRLVGPTRVERYSDRPGGVEVLLDDGDSYSVGLLLGCDGRQQRRSEARGDRTRFPRLSAIVAGLRH